MGKPKGRILILMVAIEHEASFPVSVTENAVISTAGIFVYDRPKTIEEHFHDFCDIGRAKLVQPEPGKLSLVCGVASGIVVLQIGPGRGDFIPDLDRGKYGVGYTMLGNILSKTKRIVDVKTGTTHAIFGILPDQWLDGLNSCTLVHPNLEGRGPIRLLADGAVHPIEPTPAYRFYTPFQHLSGAGLGFLMRGFNGELVTRPKVTVHPLYLIGVMTLDRTQLSELLRAFNKDWINGHVFACKNPVPPSEPVGTSENGGA